MSEDEGQPRPVASRRQVWRMTRHHLVPLAAMGVAAAESVAVLCCHYANHGHTHYQRDGAA